ncbi:hypothetical protein LCGC14_2776050 [marine sediment metagenome]|uniref:HicB-like antitoxin of toxin-antitoxin system domain-containing protein n=1 Tax=marine sediment metagenome TaxID=412755 RepID=A0A0F8YUK9_9ZZZZ
MSIELKNGYVTDGVLWPIDLEKGEDGWWIASCPSLKGCHSQGDSKESALFNMVDAIEGYLEAKAER